MCLSFWSWVVWSSSWLSSPTLHCSVGEFCLCHQMKFWWDNWAHGFYGMRIKGVFVLRKFSELISAHKGKVPPEPPGCNSLPTCQPGRFKMQVNENKLCSFPNSSLQSLKLQNLQECERLLVGRKNKTVHHFSFSWNKVNNRTFVNLSSSKWGKKWLWFVFVPEKFSTNNEITLFEDDSFTELIACCGIVVTTASAYLGLFCSYKWQHPVYVEAVSFLPYKCGGIGQYIFHVWANTKTSCWFFFLCFLCRCLFWLPLFVLCSCSSLFIHLRFVTNGVVIYFSPPTPGGLASWTLMTLAEERCQFPHQQDIKDLWKLCKT